MPYASLTHLQAHLSGVRLTASSTPTADAAAGFLEDGAAIIDGILRSAGYQLPVPEGATGALGVLRRANVAAAAADVRAAMPAGGDDAKKAAAKEWDRWQAWLDPSASGRTLDLGLTTETTERFARSGFAGTSAILGRNLQL